MNFYELESWSSAHDGKVMVQVSTLNDPHLFFAKLQHFCLERPKIIKKATLKIIFKAIVNHNLYIQEHCIVNNASCKQLILANFTHNSNLLNNRNTNLF